MSGDLRKCGDADTIAGRIATPFMSEYHATKFAIEGISESLRYELSLHGIRVKLVEPVHFKTNFLSGSLQTVHHPAYAKAFDNFMGYVHKEDAEAPGPESVAEAIFRAANDRSNKLRFPVGAELILALTALFPDSDIQIVSDIVQQGKYAARFTIHPEDVFDAQQLRVQLGGPKITVEEGAHTYVSSYVDLELFASQSREHN